MEFLWWQMAVGWIAIPLLVWAYVRHWQRRKRFASAWGVGDVAAQRLYGQNRRQHVLFAVFLIGIAIAIIAAMRPQWIVTLPEREVAVIVALDVSGSMAKTDLLPTRLDAAKQAASTLVERMSPNAQVGVVAFASDATLVQAPTAEHELAQKAIRQLTTGANTAIGSAIITSLAAITEIVGSEQPIPAIIVLLTDGMSNTGPTPLDAAQVASEQGIKVLVIGVGSNKSGDSALDEATMREVARLTDGKYYRVGDETELLDVYATLEPRTIWRTRKVEAAHEFVAAAVGMMIVYVGARWLG